MLIKPKIIQIKDIDDIELKYQISRIPALHFIDILKIYPFDSKNIPKIDNETLLSLLRYVSYYDGDSYITLDNEDKINKYITDAETLLRIETNLEEIYSGKSFVSLSIEILHYFMNDRTDGKSREFQIDISHEPLQKPYLKID